MSKSIKQVGASAILMGMIIPWLSWLSITSLAAFDRVTKVESQAGFNKESMQELKDSLKRIEGSLYELREEIARKKD